MLKLTPRAASALVATRQKRDLPEHYGVRITAGVDGGRDLRLGFVSAPAERDRVAEQHGVKLFVADDVADQLADVEIDATADTSDDAIGPVQLVVRRQGEGHG